MRGRKPLPTKLKIFKGNPGRRPLNKTEPEPEIATLPEPPEHFGLEARIEWVRVTQQLAQIGLLTNIDLSVLEIGVEAFGRMREAAAALKKLGPGGMIIKTTSGNWINNPLIGIRNKAGTIAAQIYAEFGMTPSSRTRLSVNPEANKSTWDYERR